MAKLIPIDEELPPVEGSARLTPVETTEEKKAPAAPKSFTERVKQAGEGVGRGALDVGQGIKQLYLMATNPQEAAKYTADVNRQVAEYEAQRGGGFDVPRMIGSTIATAPAMFIPGGQAALAARLGMGAIAGGLSGIANFSEAGTWEDKAIQAGIGGVAGAAVPEAVRQGVKAVVGTGQAAGNVGRRVLGPGASSADIMADIQRAGAQIDVGFDINKLSAGVRDRLMADAQAQLKNTGKLDTDALMRSQDYARLGITPTMAQLSRDPRQWQTERNLAQIQGVGDPLLGRFSEQPGIVRRNLEELRTGTAGTPYEAGRTAIETIGSRKQQSGMFGELGGKIDEIYTQARSAPGAQAEIPFRPFKERIASTLEQFEDKIPAPIAKRLQDFEDPKGTRYFSVAEAAKFRELINARIADGDPTQAKALGQLKRQLDSYMTTVGDSVGTEGVEAIKLFSQGVQASAKRAQEFGAAPLAKAVEGKVEPDDFFQRFILNGKVGDLNQLKSNLNRTDVSAPLQESGRQAWDNIRGQTIQYLLNRASPDGQSFSQANFRQALESLGPRVEVLFTPEERGMLFTIQRASQNLFAPPATGGVPIANTSGTAAALANLMQRVSAVPGAGSILQASASALREQAQMNAAQRALLGGAGGAAAAQRAADQEIVRRMMSGATVNPFGLQPFATAVPSILEVNRDARPNQPPFR